MSQMKKFVMRLAALACTAGLHAEPVDLHWIDKTPDYKIGQSWGVPFAKGTMNDQGTFTLTDASGRVIPDQHWVLARWNDGSEKFMRFTESWRSGKPGGWAISAKGVEGDENKLNAALKLLDYAYSPEGQILMSYGPEAFRDDANTFDFFGKKKPHISAKNYEDLWSLAKGNYTNFARQYLGSTLSFNKTQAFEMERTTAVGKEGLQNITNAISLGLIKHPELTMNSNMWYTIVPTVLPTS